MSKGTSIPTRVSADVAACATAVAPTESRSFTEQINHWARIGMQVERSGSLLSRRVLAVATGDEQFSSLSTEDRVTAHALIDADIAARAAKQRFGSSARQAGQATVCLDEDGKLIEIAPNGTRRAL